MSENIFDDKQEPTVEPVEEPTPPVEDNPTPEDQPISETEPAPVDEPIVEPTNEPITEEDPETEVILGNEEAEDLEEMDTEQAIEVTGDAVDDGMKGLDSLETDMDGLEGDIDTAERALSETGKVPDVVMESINRRINKAIEYYHIEKPKDPNVLAYESYALNKDADRYGLAIEAAKESLKSMASRFVKGTVTTIKHLYGFLGEIESGAKKSLIKLDAVESEFSNPVTPGPLNEMPWQLRKGYDWGGRLSARTFIDVIKQQEQYTSEIEKRIMNLSKLTRTISETLPVSENIKEDLDGFLKQFKGYYLESIGTEEKPFFGGMYLSNGWKKNKSIPKQSPEGTKLSSREMVDIAKYVRKVLERNVTWNKTVRKEIGVMHSLIVGMRWTEKRLLHPKLNLSLDGLYVAYNFTLFLVTNTCNSNLKLANAFIAYAEESMK